MTDGYMVFTVGTTQAFNLTRYHSVPYIGLSAGTVEGNYQLPYAANTAKKLWIKVTGNTLDGAAQIMLRKNGGDTALFIDINVGVTGVLTATADVAIADGDLLNIQILTVGASVGNLIFASVGVTFLLP